MRNTAGSCETASALTRFIRPRNSRPAGIRQDLYRREYDLRSCSQLEKSRCHCDPSHRVIGNLLDEIYSQACSQRLQGLNCVQKVNTKSETPGWIVEVDDNKSALEAAKDDAVRVIAGTTWLWAREDMREAVDVLIVDEAGQMSLANVLAVLERPRTSSCSAILNNSSSH